MKILMASHYFSSHKGGVEIVADALYGALAAEDREVVWMAGAASPPPEAKDHSRAVPLAIFNFVEAKTGLPFPIPTFTAMRKILREVKQANILILHDCLYLSNILAFIAAKWRGIPVLIIQHTRYFPGSSMLINAAIKLATLMVTHPMLKRAGQVVFIGKTTMESYEKLRYRNPPQLIYNGVNTTLFRKVQGDETVAILRAIHGLPDDRKVILFVGRFVEKKGLLIIKRMAAMRPEWIWCIAGWGPIDPNQWKLENVRVFTGLDDPAIAELYRCSDLFVLPSTGEGGFALAIREALASGIPVVCGEETLAMDPSLATQVKGALVMIGDDERSAQEFLAAINETLAQDTQSRLKAEERHAYAYENFSWHHATERYLQIIDRLVRSSTANAQVSPRGAAE